MSWTKRSWDWTTWETWNKVSLSCCCSSPTFFSHKFTQHHTFPRNILPWNVPFQWKTASVTNFFSQLWLWAARPHGHPLGRAQCICLGVQHPLKRWCYRLRIDSTGPNISSAKMRRRMIFFFWHCFSTMPGYSENIRQYCSTKPEAHAHMGWYWGLTSQEPAQSQWKWTMKQSFGGN